MLKINNLSKIYQSKTGVSVNALMQIDLDFQKRGLVFILGKSGSGKSTLLNLVGGLDKPTDGEIIIDGRSSKTFTESDFDSYRNTYVGFVFQEYNLIDDKTVSDNIALALELQGKCIENTDREEIDRILKLLDLIDRDGKTLKNRKINELSGGQKQRVAIARALIKEPKIILADEPTGALDSKTGAAFYDLLKSLSSDRLIIVVTHDRENAEKYGDRIIELSDGQVMSDTVKGDKIGDEISDEKKASGEFIACKLPFKRRLQLGAEGLRVKKFRLAVSMILSIFAFIIFGFSITAAFVDENTTIVTQMYRNNHEIMVIESASTEIVLSDNGNGRYTTTYLNRPLYDRQIDLITEYNDGISPMWTSSTMSDIDLDFTVRDYLFDVPTAEEEDYARDGSISAFFVEVDSNTDDKYANLQPDNRFINKDLCRLPETFNEIAITDLKADMFIRYGYKTENNEKINIDTPDDLIGKTVGEFTIVGVYSTEIELQEVRKLYFDNSEYDDEYLSYLQAGLRYAVLSYSFVKTGLFLDRDPSFEPYGVMTKLSGSLNKDKKLLNELYLENGNITQDAVVNSMYTRLISVAASLNYLIIPIGLGGAAVFGVVAVLLIMFFLNVSLDSKKRDIGILRALGARKIDIAAIVLVEILLITAVNFIVSLTSVIVICSILNALKHVPIFIVNFAVVALFFAFSFGVSVIATIVPIIRITKRKPVDIINGK